MVWQRYVALVYCVLLRYWTSMLWSIDTYQNKVSSDQYHVTISRAQVYSSLSISVFLKLIADQVLVFRLDRGLMSGLLVDVRKPVNANPGLKVNRIIIFLLYKCFRCFLLCIWLLLKLKTEGQTIYKKLQRKVRKLKSKFCFFLS